MSDFCAMELIRQEIVQTFQILLKEQKWFLDTVRLPNPNGRREGPEKLPIKALLFHTEIVT